MILSFVSTVMNFLPFNFLFGDPSISHFATLKLRFLQCCRVLLKILTILLVWFVGISCIDIYCNSWWKWPMVIGKLKFIFIITNLSYLFILNLPNLISLTYSSYLSAFIRNNRPFWSHRAMHRIWIMWLISYNNVDGCRITPSSGQCWHRDSDSGVRE